MTDERALKILESDWSEAGYGDELISDALELSISALRDRIERNKTDIGIPITGGWISVKDRLPEETDEKVIIACKTLHGKLSYTTTAYYRKSKGLFEIRVDGDYVFGSVGTDDVVTHWMPLPKPPYKEEKK